MEENKIPETAIDDNAETVSGVADETEEDVAETIGDDSSESKQINDESVESENGSGEVASEESDESERIEEHEEQDSVEEPKKKKKRFLQIPVIISACLVLLVLLSYFVFTSFLLREPEGIVWTGDVPLKDSEGNVVYSTYYYEFDKNNEFRAYVGSVEIKGNYSKSNDKEAGKIINVGIPAGVFRMMENTQYEITGSRIFNNQEFKIKYSDGTEFTLKQSKLEKPTIELPEGFVPDSKLIGEWVTNDMGSEVYHVNFGDDGLMSYGVVNNTMNYSINYYGSYTIDGETINFTHYTSTKGVAAPLEYYLVDDNTLFFMGQFFVKAESLATADQTAK